jgi:hypothetical protein
MYPTRHPLSGGQWTTHQETPRLSLGDSIHHLLEDSARTYQPWPAHFSVVRVPIAAEIQPRHRAVTHGHAVEDECTNPERAFFSKTPVAE